MDVIVVVFLYDFNMVVVYCDDILVMEQGYIIVFGFFEEVLMEILVFGVFSVSVQFEQFSKSQNNYFFF